MKGVREMGDVEGGRGYERDGDGRGKGGSKKEMGEGRG